MSDLILLPLQQAIWSLLEGDATLGSAVTGVFDRVPEDTAYPYVTIGDASCEDWSNATQTGARSLVTLHVYSRKRGRKEALEIMQQLHALLHDHALTISGHHCIHLRFKTAYVSQESDGLTYHGQMRFEVLTQAA